MSAYPSHGFVIDRAEARTIFNKVVEPDAELREIGDFFKDISDVFTHTDKSEDAQVWILSSTKKLDSGKIKGDGDAKEQAKSKVKGGQNG